MKYIKTWSLFESDDFSQEELYRLADLGLTPEFEDPNNYDEDWPGYSNLADWLKDAQGGDPRNCADVKDAVEIVCNDCGKDPEYVSIVGVLTSEAESKVEELGLEPVERKAAYPGAPTINKHKDPSTGITYYLISMYDGTIVATPNRRIKFR